MASTILCNRSPLKLGRKRTVPCHAISPSQFMAKRQLLLQKNLGFGSQNVSLHQACLPRTHHLERNTNHHIVCCLKVQQFGTVCCQQRNLNEITGKIINTKLFETNATDFENKSGAFSHIFIVSPVQRPIGEQRIVGKNREQNSFLVNI